MGCTDSKPRVVKQSDAGTVPLDPQSAESRRERERKQEECQTRDQQEISTPPQARWERSSDAFQKAKVEMSFEDTYTEGRKLGEGQFGVVFIGKHQQNGKEYAIKKVDRSKMVWNDRDNLKSEISISNAVRDGPHIVRLYEHYYSSGNDCFLVMELMKGGTLFDLVVAKQSFTEKEARDSITCLLKAVLYMHKNRVVHRDIKPENLLLAKPNLLTSIKIADFGFAKKVVSHDSCRTLCGTPGYVAPEVLDPWPVYGDKCDMWSIGVVLFLLLGGYLPFDDENEQKVHTKTRNGLYEFHPHIFGHIAMEAKEFVTRLLTIDPAKRLSAGQAIEHGWMKRDDRQLQEKQVDIEKQKAALLGKAKLRKVVNVINVANNLKDFDQAHNLTKPSHYRAVCRLVTSHVEDSETGNPFSHFYELGKQLGVGGFAVVHQAVHKASKGTYAVKKVELQEHDRRVIDDEIVALKFLRGGPHIIQLHDVFKEDSAVFMVLDEMRGGNVLQRICEKEVYTEREARDMCKALFKAIDYMHNKKIAHRDLKPENILLVEKGDDTSIKLADFGFAKMVPSNKCLTTFCGTASYVAPEILDVNANGYDERVDMWSIGVVVYILLGGYAPFEQQNFGELLTAILQGDFEFHANFWSHISFEAKNLISSLLQVDPEGRASAESVLHSDWMTAEGETLSANDLSTAQNQMRKSLPINKFRGAVKATIAAGKFGSLGESPTSVLARRGNPAHSIARNRETNSEKKSTTFAEVYTINTLLNSWQNHDMIAATDKKSGILYNVKRVQRKHLNPSTAVALQEEMMVLKLLKGGQYITGLQDVVEEPNTIFVILERMWHGCLIDRMLNKNMACYSEYSATIIAKKLLTGMKYCHDRRVAHRNLKLENILLVSEASDTDVKISDFGYSKRVQFPNSLRTQCGTEGYVAPEIIAHNPAYDTKCDMWSLGVVLYIVIGGYRPFSGTWDETLRKIRYGEYEFHRKYWSKISSNAKTLISAMLTVDPNLRINAKGALNSTWITSFAEF